MENNQTHNRFWHREFNLMCFVNFLMLTAVIMQYPLIGMFAENNGFEKGSTFVCAAFFCVGMFLPGPLSGYLVDAFKRKSVCAWSILGVALTSFAFSEIESCIILSLLRIVEGACFGLFQMALGGTLINDLSISSRRTQTDYYYLWLGRLGFPLGLLAISFLTDWYAFKTITYFPVILMVLSLLIVLSLRVPFRAPNKVSVLSFDRFLYPRAWLLSLNLLPIAILQGFLIDGCIPPLFMALFGAGLLIAFITHRNFFEEADDRADAVTGMLLMIASFGMLLFQHEVKVIGFAYVLLGVGMGWFNSRFLLYFLKLSGHCQRGTLQQTYILVVSVGISIGFVLSGFSVNRFYCSLVLVIIALLQYLCFTHRWFLKHSDRNFKFREV